MVTERKTRILQISVLAGRVPAIHALPGSVLHWPVDGRDTPGHDDLYLDPCRLAAAMSVIGR
jgi:hypothetical protein